MNLRARRVAVLLFGSGLTALVYQVAWLRQLRLIFGASTPASAAVTAIFMGGLGAGAWLLGRRADTRAAPLAFYGRLELGVAASAAATPALVWLVERAYVATGGSFRLGLAGASAVRLLLASLVLALPTVLMGGTLPAAARSVETEDDAGRRVLALLYGANAFGAVAGAMLSNFFLLERLGTRATVWAAAAVNAAVALMALRLARADGPVSDGAAGPESTRRSSEKAEMAAPPAAFFEKLEAPPPKGFVLAAAAIAGFAFLLMELVWYRMLAPLLGGSTYTYGLVLAIALAGIGLGAWLYSRRGLTRPATLAGFAGTCALEALCLALPLGLGDRIAISAVLLRPFGAFGFAGFVASWTVIASVVVFPAACVAGYQFPLVIGLLGRGRQDVGRDIGAAYSWNVAGGIAGSLAGGFGLLPLFSAPGVWRLCVALLALTSAAAMALAVRRGDGFGRLVAPLCAAAGAVLLLGAAGPTAAWRHSPIGVGRIDIGKVSPNLLQEWLNLRRRMLAWEAEGLESSVALLKTSDGYAFALNGKIDGSARGDAETQVMSGLVGAALHPDPRRALVVGLGTGSTAGWLAAVASIDRVDVVELERATLSVARDCASVNHDAMTNPKIRTVVGDGREFLLTSREKYDIIFSEPTNPFLSGVSSLFTREFYRAVEPRLSEKGLFIQWLQGYEVDAGTVRTIYATVASVFPRVETWCGRPNDLLLVASRTPIERDARSLGARLAGEPYASAMRAAWGVTGLEGFLSHFVARNSLARAIASAEGERWNSDDRNRIEFAFARSLGNTALFNVDELRALSAARVEDRPEIGGEVDWALVGRQRIATVAADGGRSLPDPGLPRDLQRQAFVLSNFVDGRPDVVFGAWRAEPWTPQGPVELAALADAVAWGGDEAAAQPLIADLAKVSQVEADAILGHLRWRQGRFPESAAALAKAFTAYRGDPWPLPPVMKAALAVAVDVASKDPVLAAVLFDSLAYPFAAGMLDEERSQALQEAGAYAGLAKYAEALAPIEPNVPWLDRALDRRVRAYEAIGSPRLPRARRDLERFRSQASAPLADGLYGH
jgi:predicted membrane-bound spermidine synthase